jgi:hypothetical protein
LSSLAGCRLVGGIPERLQQAVDLGILEAGLVYPPLTSIEEL